MSTGKTWQQSSNIIGIYAQDTWRVTDRLTLNLGLRYDAHTPWVETNNEQANYNIATGNIDLAGKNGASRGLYEGFYGGRDFQPRIGFAWTPAVLGDHTVIRGAFTISSYLEGTGTNLRLTLNPPFTPAEINAIYNGTSLPPTDTTDGIAGTASAASCDAPAYACYAGAFLRVWDPKVQPAIADEWNLTVQHQFGRQHHPPSRIRGTEGNSLDGAIRLRTESAAAEFGLRDSALHGSEPVFCREPSAL